jgi:cell division protein FtsB
VLSRRAAETKDFIRLLSTNDYIINRLRNQLGRPNGVPVDQAVKFLERNEELRQETNKLNAEMCQALGMSYRAPGGFNNPLKEGARKRKRKRPSYGFRDF